MHNMHDQIYEEAKTEQFIKISALINVALSYEISVYSFNGGRQREIQEPDLSFFNFPSAVPIKMFLFCIFVHEGICVL